MSRHNTSNETSDSDSNLSYQESSEEDEQSDRYLMAYDPSFEPIATEEQAAAHEQARLADEEEEREFQSRFSGEKPLTAW